MMRTVKRFSYEFVYGGHWPAISTSIIAFVASLLLGLKFPFLLFLIIYLCSYIIYAFDRFLDLEIDEKNVAKEALLLKKITYGLVVFFAIILVFYAAKLTNPQVVEFLAFLLIVGIGYNIYFKKVTRKIPGFKSFFVAFSFPSVMFFIPIFNQSNFDIPFLLVYVFFVIRLFANTVFCDIKDKGEDSQEGLRTFPVILKKSSLVKFLKIINLVSIVPLILGVIIKQLPLGSLFLLFTIFYFFYYLNLMNNNKFSIKNLSAYWADGEPIVWFLFGCLGGIRWIV